MSRYINLFLPVSKLKNWNQISITFIFNISKIFSILRLINQLKLKIRSLAQEIIHILPTYKTPEVLLDPHGTVKIKGRLIDESRTKGPDQILTWIDAYLLNPAKVTEVTIALEFLNSYNTIVLISILKRISQVIQHGKKIAIRWYYEEDDIDIFERGEYISSTINIPIEFILTDRIDGC
jgi:hypothetical protein